VHIAFQNVAASLRAIQTDAVASQKAVASEAAAGRSLEITRHRHDLSPAVATKRGLAHGRRSRQDRLAALPVGSCAPASCG